MNTSRIKAQQPLSEVDALRLARRDWLSPIEVAHYVGCCLDTIYRAIHNGRLQARRMGRSWRIHRDWVDNGFLREARTACQC